MSEGKMHPVYSDPVVGFITVARDYCTFIENLEKNKAGDILNTMLRFLPVIYVKASLLPVLESVMSEDTEDYVTEEIYSGIHEHIKKCLGEGNIEVSVPETSSRSGEDVAAELSETWADIYQDLKNVSEAYSTGLSDIMNDAVWLCKQNFGQYWGPVLLASLSAVHKLVYIGADEVSNTTGRKERDTSGWIISQRQKEWGKG
jgi:hypothetical protein